MRSGRVGKVMAWAGLAGAVVVLGVGAGATASPEGNDAGQLQRPMVPGGSGDKKPDFKPFKDVADGYEKVVSTADGKPGLYTVYFDEKSQQLLAELPRGWERQKHFIAGTVAAGDIWAGLQGPERYVYWKRFDKRMALIQPEIGTRSSGDQESKDAVSQTFTDRVLLDVPIVTMGPKGQPVIDLDDLLVKQGSKFFGRGMSGANTRLVEFTKVKSFPQNLEVTVRAPVGNGTLREFHYSISNIPSKSGYKPRVADERVGYFTTAYRDLGKYRADKKWVRYINRWRLEKADKKLSMSPPKNPIVFYIDHTTPVRYRRWVREGAESWNAAFENIGIVGAIEIRQQDKASGAYMDLDPEDVRYNFIRWVSNDISTAIGPSRAHPMTGEILDADVVLTDGWISAFWGQYNTQLPEMVMEGMNPETVAWLEENPRWDPRVRLADPAERDALLVQRAMRRAEGRDADERRRLIINPALADSPEFAGLHDHLDCDHALCLAARGKAHDMALARVAFDALNMLEDDHKKKGKKGEDEEGSDEPKADKLDGIPDWFVGPLLADLVAHEIGHTLGLRHNFKASSIYSLAEINSESIKGQKAFTGSVMDYNPVNINMEDGEIQGDFAMIAVGPYDKWAIEYGYGFGDPKKVLERVSEPELAYLTDEDTIGTDPLARRYDFGADPHNYAQSRMRLVRYLRGKLLEKFVKEGESWSGARRGYRVTLSTQAQSLSMMANWVGGSYVNRDRKGDPGDRLPVTPVEPEKQREAIAFIIDNAFYDEAFGLTPDLLRHLTVDKWSDGGGRRDYWSDAAFDVHDRVMGVQASALTMLMNPTTLRRVYDNEFAVPEGEDAVTLAELMDSVTTAIWSETDKRPSTSYTAREPMVSSMRRNLQREHLERLIDLSMPGSFSNSASKTVSTLAILHLKQIRDRSEKLLNGPSGKLDPYTLAHLDECRTRIEKALEAEYIYNTDDIAGGGMGGMFFFRPNEKSQD